MHKSESARSHVWRCAVNSAEGTEPGESAAMTERCGMKVVMENGKSYTPKPDDAVFCETHNYGTTWKRLNPIQQLAVSSSICTLSGMRCLLRPDTKSEAPDET